MWGALKVRAHAKINLSLEVVGRRADGYHDLVSVMQTLTLADTLRIEEGDGVVFRCSDRNLETEDNLCVRAARLLRSRCAVPRGCSLSLEKEIPASAGLGGGSSDAGATLAALNAFWNAGASCADLRAMAEELGSDVPFFLYGGTALVEGRGERVRRLRNSRPVWYVLANPGVAVSTAAVFAALAPDEWSDGETTRDLSRSIADGTPTRLMGVNDLQRALFRVAPEARSCFELMSTLVSGRAFVTGSGPTVVAGFDSAQAARQVAEKVARALPWARVAQSYAPEPGEAPCG
jgi:4-diphosphocytidyl-2-C-methyl-D-erythritol kinase